MALRLLSTFVLALAVIGASAGTAGASESRTWTNKHQVPSGHGHGKARLKVEFLSKRVVDFQGWVLDVCPADQETPYLWVTVNVRQRNGYLDRRGYWSALLDDDSCAAGTKKRFDPPAKKLRKGEVILSLRGEICQRQLTHDTPCTHGSFRKFKNWRA